jgi:hypothetical protein
MAVLMQELASDMNKSRRMFHYPCAIVIVVVVVAGGGDSDYFIGDQLQENFRRWLSPPDPSINYNTAWNAHHEGSAEWFIHGYTYLKWRMSTGSLLWIHGKRT